MFCGREDQKCVASEGTMRGGSTAVFTVSDGFWPQLSCQWRKNWRVEVKMVGTGRTRFTHSAVYTRDFSHSQLNEVQFSCTYATLFFAPRWHENTFDNKSQRRPVEPWRDRVGAFRSFVDVFLLPGTELVEGNKMWLRIVIVRFLKGQVHPKVKMQSLSTPPHVDLKS